MAPKVSVAGIFRQRYPQERKNPKRLVHFPQRGFTPRMKEAHLLNDFLNIFMVFFFTHRLFHGLLKAKYSLLPKKGFMI